MEVIHFLLQFQVETAESYLGTVEKAGILINMQVRWVHIVEVYK